MKRIGIITSPIHWLAVALIACVVSAGVSAQDDRAIDFNKARQLLRKQQSGQTLTEEEASYLQRARQIRRQQRRGRERPENDRSAVTPGKTSVGLTPLTDFQPDQKYKGHTGGLYGQGRNEPPQEHLAAAMKAARSSQPLGPDGRPTPDGKIVLISNGMSNTTGEFRHFVQVAQNDPEINPHLVIVDAAQGGQEASDWADPENRYRQERPNPWEVQEQRLKQAGVTPAQVQVVWMKQARRNPASLGEFPKHAEELKKNMADVLRRLKEEFPNLKLAYVSSRTYAGYAATPLNPEPYAYESAWANQWLIQDQVAGKPELNYDSARGEAVAPVILWGPYLWADGEQGRAVDDLTYSRDDFARDGTHPADPGREKVTAQLLKFFKTDPTAKVWFLK